MMLFFNLFYMHNLTISPLNQKQNKNCHGKAQIKVMWRVWRAEDGVYYFKNTPKCVTRALRER